MSFDPEAGRPLHDEGKGDEKKGGSQPTQLADEARKRRVRECLFDLTL